jgi:small-conductance mechanosensitive channel
VYHRSHAFGSIALHRRDRLPAEHRIDPPTLRPGGILRRHRHLGASASFVLALFALAFIAGPTRASAASDSLAQSGPSFDVTLGGERLYSISTAFKTIPTAERARLVSERLESLARNSKFDPDSLRVIETEVSSDIQAGDLIAIAVLDADTIGTGLDRQALAAQRAQLVRAAILRYQKARNAHSLLWDIGATLLATLTLVAGLIVISRLRRRASAIMNHWIEERREKIKTRTHSILEPDRLLGALASLLHLLAVLFSLFAAYFYASFVLGLFPGTHAVGAHLSSLVLAPLRELGAGFVNQLPGLVFIAVVAVVTHYVLKLVGFIFAEIGSGRIHLERFYPEWALPTERIVRVVIVALALVVVYPSIPGSNSLAFKGVSIFLGVLVSLGSSSTVGNLMAGIMVVYMRSYRVGDVIKVGEEFGRVVETDMLATRLRTPKNVEITIPNLTMITSNVINFSRQASEAGLILHSEVSIGYNAPWRQVHAMLLRAAARTSGILKDPVPYVLQRELGDFAITYQINGFTREPERMTRIYSDLHKNIQDEFNEHGVEIMTPHYEMDRSQPALVPKDQWYAAPAIPMGEPGADE